ncbi:MAG: DUF6754 domain-containing protein [Candidatus Bathyarchaeia archaeon]
MFNYFIVEQIIRAGRAAQLLFLLVVVAAVLLALYLSKNGKQFSIRPIEGLEATREGIARCAEMGRPVLVTPGISNLTAVQSAQTVAGLTILGEVATKSFGIGVPCLTNASDQQIILASEGIIRNSLLTVGKPELYAPGKYVRWFGADQYSYAVGCTGQILEEKPGLIVFAGYFLSDVVVTGEAGTRVDAVKVGGTLGSINFLAMMCDYLMIGEELFAASVAITEDKASTATLAGQDWSKLIVLGLGILGVILYALGNQSIWFWLGV